MSPVNTASDADQALRDFFVDECGVDESAYQKDMALFSSGVLNSLDLLRVVSFVEQTFGIKIGTWEVSLESFDTPGLIEDFVRRKVTP